MFARSGSYGAVRTSDGIPPHPTLSSSGDSKKMDRRFCGRGSTRATVRRNVCFECSQTSTRFILNGATEEEDTSVFQAEQTVLISRPFVVFSVREFRPPLRPRLENLIAPVLRDEKVWMKKES